MSYKNILLALALLVVAINAQSLAFDLRGIQYTQANDFWNVYVPCTGGSGQYTFEWDLPVGWKFENNRIRIPSPATQQLSNQYAVRCRVKDNVKGDILERSLVFRPFTQGNSFSLEVTDHDYFYGSSALSAYSQGGASIHGIDVLNRLGALVKNTGSLNFNVGGGSFGAGFGAGAGFGSGSGFSGQYSSGSGYSSSFGSQSSFSSSSSSSSSISSSYSSSSSASLYSSLPSIGQLEKYISAGAIVEIIQTIQLVVDSKIKCEAKAAYLSDFLGRIHAAIEVKKFTLNELKVIVTNALAQIQKLTVQITQLRSEQGAINLVELKKRLDALVIQLRAAYDEYNNFNSNFSSYETEIVSLEKEINEINVRYTEVQQNL